MNTNRNIFYKRAKSLWIWLLRRDFLIFLTFVGLAFIFWWGRAMSSPRDVTITIPIQYCNIDNQVVLTKELPQFITATVRDNGRELHQIAKNKLHLNINYSSQITAEVGNIVISTESIRNKLKDLLPGSTAIQQITPEVIESSYYLLQKKVVPVRVIADVRVAPQHQLLSGPIVSPDSVTIYGPQIKIDDIQYVTTDSICITHLRDSISISSPIRVAEDILLSDKQVSITWYAEEFTEKTFTIPIRTKNVPQGEILRLFPTHINATVRVGISHFTQIKETDIIVSCEYPMTQCDVLPLNILTTNSYITNIRISHPAVEYIIER